MKDLAFATRLCFDVDLNGADKLSSSSRLETFEIHCFNFESSCPDFSNFCISFSDFCWISLNNQYKILEKRCFGIMRNIHILELTVFLLFHQVIYYTVKIKKNCDHFLMSRNLFWMRRWLEKIWFAYFLQKPKFNSI